jgi:dihydrodipicolinate synthase/N-acetylneuraminate lyase
MGDIPLEDVMANAGFTRRDCLVLATSAALAPLKLSASSMPAAAEAAAGKGMRGVFMILATPFTESGEVAWDDLHREAEFIDRCGGHGLVWPQNASALSSLTDRERIRGFEVLVKAAKGKKATLVLGVQGKNTSEMLEFAKHADRLGTDAMIAMPPSEGKSEADYREYFVALAKATNRPVIIQTTGGNRNIPPPSTDLILGLAREYPPLGYVKEESDPLVERMRAELKHRDVMKSIFGARSASGWLLEMRLGLDGIITGQAVVTDVLARAWDAHLHNRPEEARDIYGRFLLITNLVDSIPGADIYLLKKRGVFKSLVTRRPPAGTTPPAQTPALRTLTFLPDEIAEIEFRFEGLKPYLVPMSTS